VSRAARLAALRMRLLAQGARLAENPEAAARQRPMAKHPPRAHHAVAIRAMRSAHPAPQSRFE
jgi:hypothetical protein